LVAEKISEWVNQKFENTHCYLIEVKISGQNTKIQVLVDCDNGISIDTCAQLSRYLEHQLEQNSMVPDNYILEVSSPGIGYPFKFQRQYSKSINRNIEVTLHNGTIVEGVLQKVSNTDITIAKKTGKTNKLKPGQKSKEEETPITLPFSEIKTAKEKIVF